MRDPILLLGLAGIQYLVRGMVGREAAQCRENMNISRGISEVKLPQEHYELPSMRQ